MKLRHVFYWSVCTVIFIPLTALYAVALLYHYAVPAIRRFRGWAYREDYWKPEV